MPRMIATGWGAPREIQAVEVVDPIELSDETIAKLAKAIAEELKK
jgi:hypothetical protein